MSKLKKIAIVGAGSAGMQPPRFKGLLPAIAEAHKVKETIGVVTPHGVIDMPKEQVADAVKFAAQADDIKAAIARQEAKCLKIIHARYCMLNGWPINDIDLSKVIPEAKAQSNPFYYEYWYMFGTPGQYFLMSREIVIHEGNVKLNIGFNPELARDGENE